MDALSFYLEQDKELQNTVWQQGRNYSSHFFFITVFWWIPAVTFVFYFGWFTNCHMSGTFKWQFGAWLINLQDATRFEELELHNLEFCQPENCPLCAWEMGKRLTLLRCLGQESSLAFLSAFIFLYLCVLPDACSFSWVFSVLLRTGCSHNNQFSWNPRVQIVWESLSWEILETCSWSGFRQALGITAGHIWAWRPKEFRSINRKFGARGKTQDLTQYCITEGYDGNTTSACCLYLPQKHPGLGILD